MDKAEKRRLKMASQHSATAAVPDHTTSAINTGPIDCACVIHGNAYGWIYVEHLYNMLTRHITPGIRLHVYTEADRFVPQHMIRHNLEPWHITRPRGAWWYKMQLFNPIHHAGPLLYFDLDTVIVSNIDWIWQQPVDYFWAVHDFKYLWRPSHTGINSSIMWWDTQKYQHIWHDFVRQDLQHVMRKYPGDQDYIGAMIGPDSRFLDQHSIVSWRWQCLDGGYDFRNKRGRTPGSGTVVPNQTSVMVFHGNPKPDMIADLAVLQHWR